MTHYFYKCFDCSNEYTPEEIENNFIYLCPKCGTANRNEPLKGVLKILYDYKTIREKVSKEHFLKNPVGEIWNFPYLLPLETGNNKITNSTGERYNQVAWHLWRNFVSKRKSNCFRH